MRFLKNQWVTFHCNPMEGGRAKNPVLFFFTYVHPGLKIFFFVNSYLLVMAYKGLVSIFLYLSPFWRNSTMLLSPVSRGQFENLTHWNLSISPLLLERHCFLWKSRLVASYLVDHTMWDEMNCGEEEEEEEEEAAAVAAANLVNLWYWPSFAHLKDDIYHRTLVWK